jgi:hypothetical protein
VRRWLELVSASDHPDAVLSYVSELPAEYKTLRQLREIGQAIGFSPSSKAVAALIGVGKLIPEFVAAHEWLHVLLRRGDEAAASYLVELLSSGTGAVPGRVRHRRKIFFRP